MTNTPEQFPDRGEYINPPVTIDSRFPHTPTPRLALWPTQMHVDDVRIEAEAAIPVLTENIATPIMPATKSELAAMFAKNPHDRRLPWTRKDGEGGVTTYTTGAYEGVTDAKGSTPLFDGVNYTFDENGRLIQREYIEGERSYDRGRPRYQEFFTYDDGGYLTERTTWAKYEQSITDRFDYTTDENGTKSPSKLTRTVKVRTDYDYEDSEPMVVDLANFNEWVSENPNGIKSISPEELAPKELIIDDFEVSERRSGIHFAHPEQVEHALVMYGEGAYPLIAGETALEHNVKAFSESAGDDRAGAMLGMFAMKSDIGQFVRERITDEVQKKWKAVQKTRNKDASESVRFSFDYDGAGHFHKSHGDIEITKDGLVLTLGAAYVGDQVEDTLATALGKKRGLRSATIKVPVNQTEKEGYFYADLRAVCDKLGIDVTDEQISDYLSEHINEGVDAETVKHNRVWGSNKKAPLWQDPKTGARAVIVTQDRDYETDTDLQEMFGRSETSLWGPLPKSIRGKGQLGRDSDEPTFMIVVEPNGDPFDEQTTTATDDTVKRFIDRVA
jgi:hypothetical protein